MADDSRPIRIGTRASALARWQANWVADALIAHGRKIELVPITTRGDALQETPVAALGTRGVFTKELQRVLLDERIDLAVHSLKDLPTESAPGIVLAAVPVRESPFDVLVSRERASLFELPKGSRIGTGSPRRQTQLWHVRPDFQMTPIRGNVDTRLRKLLEGECDGLILAEAGLKRLNLHEHVSEIFSSERMMPAVGQGALGLETRDGDWAIRAALAPIDDRLAHAAVDAERAMLDAIGGGCLAPVGGWCRVEEGRLRLEGVCMSSDGKIRLAASDVADFDSARALGHRVARALIEQGAAELISATRADQAT